MSQQPHADINPYASPKHDSGISTPFEHEHPRFRILAVFVGWFVDVVSSNVGGVVLGIVWGIFQIAQGANWAQFQQSLSSSTGLFVGGLLIGVCGSVLGGFVAAWMAKHRELQHALATGVLSLLTGIAMMSLNSFSPIPISQPAWISVLAFAVTVPAALFGGWLRCRIARRNLK